MSDQPTTDGPMRTLVEDGRVLGPSRIIRDSDPAKVTREQADAVIATINDFMARTGTSITSIARSIGISTSSVSEVLRWAYKGDWQKLVLDLDRWLEGEVKASTARPSSFVTTRVAREIFTVAEAAIHLKGIGLVFGPSGIGKTLALQAIEAEKPGARLVRIETAATTAASVIDAIALALKTFVPGVRVNRSTRLLLTQIKEALRGTSRLLIIDEIHKLCGQSNDKALNVLRDLHDATGCPMLWCGTTDLVAYLERDNGPTREPLAQIRRRIVMCRDLMERTMRPDGGPGEPLYTVDEIRSIFAAGKMRLTPDAIRTLNDLANLFDAGHLGACHSLLSMTVKLHERTADAITGEMLKAALGLMVNRRAMQHLGERLAAQQAAPSMAKARAG